MEPQASAAGDPPPRPVGPPSGQLARRRRAEQWGPSDSGCPGRISQRWSRRPGGPGPIPEEEPPPDQSGLRRDAAPAPLPGARWRAGERTAQPPARKEWAGRSHRCRRAQRPLVCPTQGDREVLADLVGGARGGGGGRSFCPRVLPRVAPERASCPAYRGGGASAKAVHNLRGSHTAGSRGGLGWKRPDRSLASFKGVAVAIQADAIATYLAELTVVEDDVLRHARERAAAGGMPPVSADSGAFLRFAASWVGAQAAVEIGSGAGYSGVWIARGLAPKGILTTIEADPGHQRLAKETYEEAGVPSRMRAILGRALDVLPRLTDGGYDLAFLDATKSEYPEYLEHALRLVRPGGVIVADNVLWSGRVADPKVTDPDTEGLRIYARRIVADDRLDSVILSIGDGLAVSRVRRHEELGA